MKRRNQPNQAPDPRRVSAPTEPPKKSPLWWVGFALAGVALVVVAGIALRSTSAKHKESSAYIPRAAGTVTFSKDVAPIIFKHCASCHRPGQSAPFSLLSYEEVKQKTRLTGEVTGLSRHEGSV